MQDTQHFISEFELSGKNRTKQKKSTIQFPPNADVSTILRYGVPHRKNGSRLSLIVMGQPHIHVFLPHKPSINRRPFLLRVLQSDLS